MTDGLVVVVEHMRGEVTETTYEMLGAARRLAGPLGKSVTAVLMGEGVAPLVRFLGAADSVLLLEKPGWRFPFTPDSAVPLGALFAPREPSLILTAGTNLSMGLGGKLAAVVGVPFVNFCTDCAARDGVAHFTSRLFGGKILATTRLPGNRGVIGIYPGSFPAEEGRSDRAVAPESVDVLFEPPRIAFKAFIEPEAGDVDITKEDILVSVGRGIQNRDNIEMAEELAAALGGAVSASRPVIDQGWLPLTRQVGKSGMSVKPRLYLALGISGAPEHYEGMKNAKLIVAVNTDAGAPIFSVARYGIHADLFDVVPALTDAIRARKGEGVV